jgi:hypothetical protein
VTFLGLFVAAVACVLLDAGDDRDSTHGGKYA